MTFAVVWRRAAENRLEAIWQSQADSDEVADAADAVNRILRDDPFGQGESRDRLTRRIWFHWPMLVVFEINESRRAVYVGAVRWLGRA